MTSTSNFATVWGGWNLGVLNVTWTLATEEQFYLLWPPILAFLLWRRVPLLVIAALTSAVAVCSLSLFWRFYAQDGGEVRGGLPVFYMRPDARAGELLAGCVVALVLAWLPRRLPRALDLALGLASLAAVAGLVVAKQKGRVLDAPIISRDIPFIVCCSAVVIARLATSDRAILSRVLRLPPLPAIGRISYALYLWHLPVYSVVNTWQIGPRWRQIALGVALSFAAAILSGILVEGPVMRRVRDRTRRDRPAPEPASAVTADSPASVSGLLQP